MKKLIVFIFSVVLLGSCGKSEYVEIPDENFEYHLILNGVDDYIDGQVLRTSAEAATELHMPSSGPSGNVDYKITSMSGIEAFINLTSITAPYNEVTGTVDLSLLVKLKTFEASCMACELILGDITKLEYVNVGHITNTSLDFTNNSNLKRLRLYGEALNCINLKFISVPNSGSFNGNWSVGPNLNCAEVSNPNDWEARYPNGWSGNADIFSINCGCF